jgi:hypothetical protein
MKLREQLITVSDIFAHCRGIGRQRLSTIVLNRGSTLDRIAEGESDITTGTFEKAMMWFSVNWPDGADWPADVPRPVRTEDQAA